MIRILLIPPLALCLGGCWQTIEPNPDITLRQAMVDVADGVQAMRDRTANREKAGLIVDEVTVVFNISSKRTSSGELGVGVSAIPVAGGGLSANAKSTSGSEDLAGNTITIKLKNVNTLGNPKPPPIDPKCYKPNPPKNCPPIILKKPGPLE
ncbi:hypothetical protein V5F32_04925 [Xanthobacter oligotrophicus]|uniref:Lipoprotein n=1 Tax=Xanthobacter oligotrophicus TaxID=2607286 RepID=A0ABW6ZS05_9HYPH